MTDWLSKMQQTFEYYIVDPNTWKDVKRIETVKSASISRDSEAETLGSGTIDITESIGESYIRIYLVTIQNGVTERFPLATMLVQTPTTEFDGRVQSITIDAYTPLSELKENQPPLGYFTPEDSNIMKEAFRLASAHCRAPVVEAVSDIKMYKDFVSNADDTWLTYISDMIANAKFYFDLDERGTILFAPKQDLASLQPVWTYDDGNSSILYPEITYEEDLYGIPNVVEVIYSDANNFYTSRVVNDDPNSPTSTINRGREITHRVTNPEMTGIPNQVMVDEYAIQTLQSLSTVTCSISYKHGYCPVRVNDCVRINYNRSGFTDIKALVVSQTIKCEPGCPVTEKAMFTKKMWR